MDEATLLIATGRDVFSALEAGAARHPDREFLVFEDASGAHARWTWEEARAISLLVAGRLVRDGVESGDRVHIHLPNRPEFLFVWMAAARLGASIVPTNPLSSVAELEYVLRHSAAVLSVTDHAGVEALASATGSTAHRWIDCDATSLLDDGPCDAPLPPLPSSHSELAVMYTSGTTSRPKGVRVTHENYLYAGEVVAHATGLTPDDRFLVVLPLFHANAQYYATLGTLVSGGTIILLHGFSASGYFDTAVRHRATVGSLFAAPIRMILAKRPTVAWRDNDLRLVLFAQNLTEDELDRWDALSGVSLLQIYGMTETIGPPVMNPLVGGRRDAIGRPSLGYAVRVVREDGSIAGLGEAGELQVHGVPGVSLMAGYLHDEQATQVAIVDGWLRTGDVVRREADGLLRFVDRRKDMIKRAGENVAASEVEAVLLEHPRVRDAAVVGVPDPVRDEQIIAFVVPDGGWGPDAASETMTAWCADRLAAFRVPSRIEVIDELPRTSVGKVKKTALRDIALAGGRPVDGVPSIGEVVT
jgi:crotonobetaine/carnitine-CoA ligase